MTRKISLLIFAGLMVAVGLALNGFDWQLVLAGGAGVPVAIGSIKPDYNGLPFRSQSINWAVGQMPINLEFLNPAMRMAAPVINSLRIRFTGSVSGVGGVAAGIDAHKLLDQIYLKDRGGEFYNLSGAAHWVLEMMEVGRRTVANPADVNSAATNTTYSFTWRVFFDAPANGKHLRSSDSGLPLTHLLPANGGVMRLTGALPTNFGVNSGSFDIIADVVDERRRELKARIVRNEQTIGLADTYYPVGGFLRQAVLTSKLATSFTSLAAQTALTSKSLDFADMPQWWFVDRYLAEAIDAHATLDPVVTLAALPLQSARQEQRIGVLPQIDQLHVKMVSVPTGGILVREYYEPRDPELARDWMGFASIADLNNAIIERGLVKGLGGHDERVQSWDEDLVRILPMRIPQVGA